MERTAHYGFFAERYQWTPDQVDRLPQWYAHRLPDFAAIVDELREEERKRAADR